MGGDEEVELEAAHLAIAQLALGDDRELALALERAVQISGRTLGVSYVGVWLLPPSADRLVLSAEFRTAAEMSARPTTLPLDAWPRYAEAIRTTRILAADDARSDPRCAELVREYLEPYDVGALLDAAIFVGGEVVGIVCHERSGPPRAWEAHERAFAGAVADMLSALFEQSRRLRAEERLRVHEQQLARSRRREILGQMSAGVAHDFRNALQVILTSLSVARREADATRRNELLDAALEEAMRANRLTRQLTDLARVGDVVRASLDLARLLSDLAPSLERIASERSASVRLEIDPALRGARVAAEQTLLERAVVNLVTNAADASPPGGVVEVRLGREGGRLVLHVDDRGPGVSPEHAPRVFDPFFTTKQLGGGTGLGLAVVALAADLFGGEVSLHPRTGGGARFTLALPDEASGLADAPAG